VAGSGNRQDFAQIPLYKGVLCNKLFAFYGSQARSVTLFIKTLFQTGFVKENKMAPSPVLVPAGKPGRACAQ
jgi:hypothetical protein